MKVVFYRAPGKFREQTLLDAVAAGVVADGDTFEVMDNSIDAPAAADVCFMVGMKASALRDRCVAAGQRVVVCDKGYDRKDDWWRVSIDSHQPTRYLMDLERPVNRMRQARWCPVEWYHNNQRRFVLIAGGGAKYHSVHRMEGPAAWAVTMVREIRAAGGTGEIQYRPKPSQPDKTVPPGAVLSAPKYMVHALADCHAMVTFGSNACFEAVLCGVPSIVLGDAVLAPISSTSLADVLEPRQASMDDRYRLLSTLAYCQFREAEWQAGTAWPEIKRQLREVSQ